MPTVAQFFKQMHPELSEQDLAELMDTYANTAGIDTAGADVAPAGYDANKPDPTTYSMVEPAIGDATGAEPRMLPEQLKEQEENLKAPATPKTGNITLPKNFSGRTGPMEMPDPSTVPGADTFDNPDAETLSRLLKGEEAKAVGTQGASLPPNFNSLPTEGPSKELLAEAEGPSDMTKLASGLGAGGALAGLAAFGGLPALAGLGAVGKAGYDLSQAAGDKTSPLGKGLSDELKRFEESDGLDAISNAVNFPKTAQEGGKIVGGDAVPDTAVNLVDTIVKALSGTAQGVLGKADKVLGNTQEALAPIADSKVARLLGLMAGASDKAAPSALISQLAFGKDITGFANKAKGGSLEQIFQKDFNSMNEDEKKFAQANWDTYLKYQGEKGDSSMGWGQMDPKSQQAKELTSLIVSHKDVDSLAPSLEFAITHKDPTVLALVAQKLAGISSVAIQQGVVSDDEAKRVLAGVNSNFSQMNAAGFSTESVQRFLNSGVWKSVENMNIGVANGLKARMKGYADIYQMPTTMFDRAGVQLAQRPLEGKSAVNQTELDAANKIAQLQAVALKYETAGEAVPAIIAATIEGLKKGLGVAEGGKPLEVDKKDGEKKDKKDGGKPKPKAKVAKDPAKMAKAKAKEKISQAARDYIANEDNYVK